MFYPANLHKKSVFHTFLRHKNAGQHTKNGETAARFQPSGHTGTERHSVFHVRTQAIKQPHRLQIPQWFLRRRASPPPVCRSMLYDFADNLLFSCARKAAVLRKNADTFPQDPKERPATTKMPASFYRDGHKKKKVVISTTNLSLTLNLIP